MQRITLIILLSLFFVLISCSESTDTTDNSEYIGLLTDNADSPIAGAIISTYTTDEEQAIESDTTDALGVFILKNIPADVSNLNIKALHSNFEPIKMSFNELYNQSGKDKKKLKMKFQNNDTCFGKIYIKVYSAKDSTVINKCEVKVRRGNATVRVSKTNEAGELSFLNVCPGEYNLRIYNDHYSVIEQNILVQQNDSSNYTFYMNLKQEVEDTCCHGIIWVFPKDSATGASINGATVKLWKNGSHFRTHISADGKVGFDGLCPGTYGVDIISDGHKSIEFQVVIACNEVKELIKNIPQQDCCNNRLQVTVRDSLSSDALGSATVKLWHGSSVVATKITESLGSVVFENICKGNYSVSVKRDGYKAMEFNIEFDCDNNIEKLVKLFPQEIDTCCTAKLKLRIKNAESINIDSAEVKVRLNGEQIRITNSNGEGWVNFEELCAPKTYSIRIYKAGYEVKEFNITFNECKTISETVTLIATGKK